MNILKSKKTIFALTLLAAMFLRPAASKAVPSLQLDIAGGSYNSLTQTIVASSNPFTLYAYLVPSNNTPLNGNYYISTAVERYNSLTNTYTHISSNALLGSFTFNGATIGVTSGMLYGTPPSADFDTDHQLPAHGIFPTYYSEFMFHFNPSHHISPYDTQTNAGGPASLSGTGMYYVPFSISTNLDPGYIIHFDLYNEAARDKDKDRDLWSFAPFSHDAESSHQIPEPSTLLLLGSGMIGFFAIRRFGGRK